MHLSKIDINILLNSDNEYEDKFEEESNDNLSLNDEEMDVDATVDFRTLFVYIKLGMTSFVLVVHAYSHRTNDKLIDHFDIFASGKII